MDSAIGIGRANQRQFLDFPLSVPPGEIGLEAQNQRRIREERKKERIGKAGHCVEQKSGM